MIESEFITFLTNSIISFAIVGSLVGLLAGFFKGG